MKLKERMPYSWNLNEKTEIEGRTKTLNFNSVQSVQGNK
jgi:hypothetical protein